ncbi:MAG: TIM barrel protein [Verrucomicrobiia bacterium]
MRLVLEVENVARAGMDKVFALASKLRLRAVLLPLSSLAIEPAALIEAEAARLRLAASNAGVTIAGLTGVMAGAAHRLVGGDTSRAAALAQLQATIRLCTELGARLMCFELSAWETWRGRLRPDQAKTLAVEVLRRCVPLAESRRVTLCVGSGEAGLAERFVRKVDHPNIRLACDAAAPKQLTQSLRDTRLVRARLLDDPKTLGKALGTLGYAHWLSLRLDGGETDAAAAQTWLKALRSAGGLAAGE